MGDIINLMDEPVQIFRSNIINLKLLLSYKLLLESDIKRVQYNLKERLNLLRSESEIAVREGCKLLILSDKKFSGKKIKDLIKFKNVKIVDRFDNKHYDYGYFKY